jgi:hypothetical protein
MAPSSDSGREGTALKGQYPRAYFFNILNKEAIVWPGFLESCLKGNSSNLCVQYSVAFIDRIVIKCQYKTRLVKLVHLWK